MLEQNISTGSQVRSTSSISIVPKNDRELRDAFNRLVHNMSISTSAVNSKWHSTLLDISLCATISISQNVPEN